MNRIGAPLLRMGAGTGRWPWVTVRFARSRGRWPWGALAVGRGPHLKQDEAVTTAVYTDGACSGNPGPGGWAWAVPGGAFASGSEKHTTNQRMEIKAAYEAVKALSGKVEVVSDSTYVVNCFRDRWWDGWIKRGWLTSAKKPVANRDLWEPFIALVRERDDEISFRWVKGHSGDVMNDVVDKLAVEAAANQTGRSGDKPADVSTLAGDAPRQKPKPAKGGEAPSGHLLMVTGHKPPSIGGYGANPTATEVKRRLVEAIAAKKAMFDDLVVVSGLSLGVEQLGAEAAVEAKVPFVAVLPFPEQDAVWPAASKDQYRKLIAAAREEILLQPAKPKTKQEAGMALGKRDGWLARHVDEALVVWDGDDDQLGRTVGSLKEHLGETEVWVLSPP